MFDFAVVGKIAADRNIVRRIDKDEICELAVHKYLKRHILGCVTTEHAMITTAPQIASATYRHAGRGLVGLFSRSIVYRFAVLNGQIDFR